MAAMLCTFTKTVPTLGTEMRDFLALAQDGASRYTKNDGKKESDLIATVTILNLWDYRALPTIENCRNTEEGHPADVSASIFVTCTAVNCAKLMLSTSAQLKVAED